MGNGGIDVNAAWQPYLTTIHIVTKFAFFIWIFGRLKTT